MGYVDYSTNITKLDIDESIRKDTENHEIIRELMIEKITNCIDSLNGLCEKLKLEPFIEIDTSDSHSVKAEINRFTTELYNQGINKH